MNGTELTVNLPQPWCPLHAPKLLWSRLIKATVGHQPEPSRPKWDDTGQSVLFEKRMLHLWLVALCVHVVMWPSIRPSSHRYMYHCNSPSPGKVSGSCLEHVALILLSSWWGLFMLWVLPSVHSPFCLSLAMTEMECLCFFFLLREGLFDAVFSSKKSTDWQIWTFPAFCLHSSDVLAKFCQR